MEKLWLRFKLHWELFANDTDGAAAEFIENLSEFGKKADS